MVRESTSPNFEDIKSMAESPTKQSSFYTDQHHFNASNPHHTTDNMGLQNLSTASSNNNSDEFAEDESRYKYNNSRGSSPLSSTESGSVPYSSPLPSLATLAATNSPLAANFHASLVSAAHSTPSGDNHAYSTPSGNNVSRNNSVSGSSGRHDSTDDEGRSYHGDGGNAALADGRPPKGGFRNDLYYCHLCNFVGLNKDKFDEHMVSHFEHNCPFCDYTSRTEGRLRRHIKDFHNDGKEDMYDPRRDGRSKINRCRQCDYATEDQFEFWTHQREHIKDDKMLQCPKCPFVTEYKHHLEYHLRNHFGSKPYKCEKCNYACVNKSMLNSHMKSHTNVYQYRCADCTYATKYCHSLKLHLKKYAHKPATVLNADGSLPTDGSGDFELVSKRGPPRGPRGTRKDKSPPPGFTPTMSLPQIPQMPMPTGVMPPPPGFWPLISAPPGLAGLPTPPAMGYKGPPPLMPVPGMNPMHLASNPLLAPLNGYETEVHCHLCEFSTSTQQKLAAHIMKAHARDHQSMLHMYGMSPIRHNSDEIQAQQRSLSPPRGPMDVTRMWAMMASAAVASQNIKMEDDAGFNRKFAPNLVKSEGPENGHYGRNSNGEHHNNSLATDLAASIEAETRTGECPLDLTKSGSTSSEDDDARSESSRKRSLCESEDNEQLQSEDQGQSGSPRKRSRKGKAYKLDALCLQLQDEKSEELPIEGNEAEDYESDTAGSSTSDEVAMQRQSSTEDQQENDETVEDDKDKVHEEAIPSPIDYDDIQKRLAELNGAYDEEAETKSNDSHSVNYDKLIQSTQKLKAQFNNDDVESLEHINNPPMIINGSGKFECGHCGISFKDCVMYTVHMGYHGFKDPFKCNMCGHQSPNKVDFFLHIARIAHE